ncbi:MAG: hypothetical protein EZS28_049550, partial [Streblomastix strix]
MNNTGIMSQTELGNRITNFGAFGDSSQLQRQQQMSGQSGAGQIRQQQLASNSQIQLVNTQQLQQFTNNAHVDDHNSRYVCEALYIIANFDFTGHYLVHYLWDVVCPYLIHHSSEVRLKCVQALVKLVIPKPKLRSLDEINTKQQLNQMLIKNHYDQDYYYDDEQDQNEQEILHYPSPQEISHELLSSQLQLEMVGKNAYWMITRAIMRMLLVVMVADPDSEVRLETLKDLSEQYDFYLSLSENIETFLLPLLNDDCLEIRKQSISTLSRLSSKNLGIITPRFHLLLDNALTQFALQIQDKQQMPLLAQHIVRIIHDAPPIAAQHAQRIIR